MVVWEGRGGQDGQVDGIFAQRYDGTGSGVGREFQVNAYTLEGQTNPAVCCDAAGNFIVAWESDGEDGSQLGIFARDRDGNAAADPHGAQRTRLPPSTSLTRRA